MVKRLLCKLWSVYIDIETSVVCKRWIGDNDSTNCAVASMLVHSDVRPMITIDGWLRMGLLPPPPREFCRHILSCTELIAVDEYVSLFGIHLLI